MPKHSIRKSTPQSYITIQRTASNCNASSSMNIDPSLNMGIILNGLAEAGFIKLYSKNHNKLFQDARKLLAESKIQEALGTLKQSLKNFNKSKHKDSAKMQNDYYLIMADCYTHLNQFDEALAYANKALAISPKGEELFSLLIEIYLKKENIDEARKVFDTRESFLVTNTGLAKSYSRILLLAANGISLFKITDKFKTEDTKTILEEISEFATHHGDTQAKANYECCLVNEYIASERYDEALKYTHAYSRSADLTTKFKGLFLSGLAYLGKGRLAYLQNKEIENKNSVSAGISFFKKIIEIYQAEKDVREEFSSSAAQAAHSLAKIYAGSAYGSKFWNPDNELYYLKFSAELGHATSCHDLGFKYHYGEDVEIDIDIAIQYYERARNGGYYASLVNLGEIKLFSQDAANESEGLALLELGLNYPDIAGKSALNKGYFYVSQIYNCLDSNKPVSLEATLSAIHYLQIALQYKEAAAYYYLGMMLFDGLGVEKNPCRSLNLLKEALKLGYEPACNKIALVYETLINNEIEAKIRKNYILELKKFANQHSIAIDENGINLINQKKIKMSKEIYNEIYKKSEDNQLQELDRINNLLDTNLEILNSNNLCMLVHKLGFLVEKNHNRIDFYKEYYEKMHRIVNEVCIYIHAETELFETGQLMFLIVGLSKLFLKNDNYIYKLCMSKLFSRAATEEKQLSTAHLFNIVHTSQRLDSDLQIFEPLKLLIDETIARLDDLEPLMKINLLKVIVVFNTEILPKLPADCLLKLIRSCVDYAIRVTNFIDANILYGSFKFLIQKEICDTRTIPWQILNNLKIIYLRQYAKENHAKTKFQNEVIYCLSQFINPKNIKEEKVITIFPVDALIRLSDTTAIILQVDGPTHFLHGREDIEPKISPRTQFRDDYLKFHCQDIITVDYITWGKLKNHDERCAYLKELVEKIEVKPNLVKYANNRHRLFINTKNSIAHQMNDDMPSGSLSGIYYSQSPSPKR